MKSITIFSITAISLFSLVVISCQKAASDMGSAMNGLNKPHRATIFLTDHESPVFDSIFIDIQKLEVKVEDDSLGNDGWITLDIRPGVYNILRFRNGLDTLFATGTLPNANIRKLRLTLGTRNSVMVNNQSFLLKIHDNEMQVVVNIDDTNFEIVGGDEVLFWIDFDAARSVETDNSGPGNNNGFELRPHLKIFTKSKSGRIEGKVLPKEADAIVSATLGTETAMAIPDDDDGEFKIPGLHEGMYSVFIHGQNGYNDTTINNVRVANGEDTHIPTITLHK